MGPQHGGGSIYEIPLWGTHLPSRLEGYLRAQLEFCDKQTCFRYLLLTCDQNETARTVSGDHSLTELAILKKQF